VEGTSYGLLQECRRAAEAGSDFPTVWHTVLKGHTLVLGPPVQQPDGLEIRLISGRRLRYYSATNRYVLG